VAKLDSKAFSRLLCSARSSGAAPSHPQPKYSTRPARSKPSFAFRRNRLTLSTFSQYLRGKEWRWKYGLAEAIGRWDSPRGGLAQCVRACRAACRFVPQVSVTRRALAATHGRLSTGTACWVADMPGRRVHHLCRLPRLPDEAPGAVAELAVHRHASDRHSRSPVQQQQNPPWSNSPDQDRISIAILFPLRYWENVESVSRFGGKAKDGFDLAGLDGVFWLRVRWRCSARPG